MTSPLADGAALERLYTGTEWAEGPVWLPRTRRVRWSDIPNDRILEWDAATGATTVYGTGVEYTNGRTLDLDGHVVQCSHGWRRVERDVGGVVTPIVDAVEGRRFNSPNDVVVAGDGAIWFTDPPYGIQPSGREGHPGEQEYGGCHVFRFDEASGELTAVVTDMEHPNGLAFSPDESVLYVADTGDRPGDPAERSIRAYDVTGGRCGNGRVFATVRPGAADGIRVDEEGRVWASSDGSVQVFTPGGERVAVVPVPEKVSNVCFGGDDGTELFVTASTSLYRIRTTTRSATHHRDAA
ncbi:SMP-30/gluconolactonase/LRE family protein [Jiangella alkaliphila]|uniref:Gluconolactonase n=1 Tax=Jiangella alkaliphila TaxID=419479 RepID=A0A1H2LBB0_9ACTN|nr:SMP-30/gluconolactonase/LRE family protein [Jiangella alkaliphila]SDU77736.1 gluconolactonase [Jiangella alkaliphila]